LAQFVTTELKGIRSAQHVIGLEALLWTEFVPSRARLDYQTHPRLAAFPETGWTPKERKNLLDFRKRLPSFLSRLDEFGVKYAPLSDVEPSCALREYDCGIIELTGCDAALAEPPT
jgi:hexosaminidase